MKKKKKKMREEINKLAEALREDERKGNNGEGNIRDREEERRKPNWKGQT